MCLLTFQDVLIVVSVILFLTEKLLLQFHLLIWLSLVGYADIEQILKEAQHRWLRPAEICEILQNYRKFHIAPEPPNNPPSMSVHCVFFVMV